MANMQVIKRSGDVVPVDFNKILTRISQQCTNLSVDASKVAQSTINKLKDRIKTEEIDTISSKIAEDYKLIHPDYAKLASRLIISNLHKSTTPKFTECMLKSNLISSEFKQFFSDNRAELNALVDDSRDYLLDYFGYKTLERIYLIKNTVGGDVVINDRPQYMYLRVACHLWAASHMCVNAKLAKIKETYDLLSLQYYTHATPTLMNACKLNGQLNSCFLLTMEDSGEGILKAVADCSRVSMGAGGVGIYLGDVRSRGQLIKRTHGKSSGILPVTKILEACMREFDQGGGRPGACAIYYPIHGGDIEDVLKLKLPQGGETERARDIFVGVCISDLFMKLYKQEVSDKNATGKSDVVWPLFSVDTAPGLSDVYDNMEVCVICNYCRCPTYNKYFPLREQQYNTPHEHVYGEHPAYTALFDKYWKENKAIKYVSPMYLMDMICKSQRESGTPYVFFRDAANRNSNQKNIGVIKGSNLCIEIVEYFDENSVANCSLASINLKKYVGGSGGSSDAFDFALLHKNTRSVVASLNQTIDTTMYPMPECKVNHNKYRPIAVGVQGLANVFMELRLPFLSKEAEKLELQIFETIYHACLTESCALAERDGPYSAFEGSPASQGVLRFDHGKYSARMYEWSELKQKIKKYGLRNSLTTALMPTASTSQILNNNESFEPIPSNIYTKTTLAGKFLVINEYMIRHLLELNLWNADIKDKIITNNGSLAGIKEIPQNVQSLYEVVWDMKQKEIINRAALRSNFIDQSQSMNVYVKNNSDSVLRAIIEHSWSLGLITGSYYIRTLPSGVKNITSDKPSDKPVEKPTDDAPVCYKGCETCSA
jgi:ribonucleoside-diphosphate reductase alpha subunit